MRLKNAYQNIKLTNELEKLIKFSIEKHGITQSLIKMYMRCKRMFFLYVTGWESIEKRLTYSNGAITHGILDKCYRYYLNNQHLPVKRMIYKWIKNYQIENNEWMIGQSQELITKYQHICKLMIFEYFNYHDDEFNNKKFIEIEKEFDFRYKEYRLRGKKDFIFQINGKTWIGETKTMAKISEANLEEILPFDFQSLFYTICEEKENKNNVTGVLYNIIRNPSQVQKKGETIQAFCKRIKLDIRKRPEHYFKRYEIPFTKQDKLEFKKELDLKLKEVNEFCKNKSYPYKRETSCLHPFKCEFLPACSAGNLNGFTKTRRLFKELEK